ncbi:hypothetical protein [Paenibacillus thermotolerans]|uniref:hypothetical protein n=1 Tax=Paenibacillus thermotolerans TaxID=3027807 RepID=UPI002367BDE6|nr:MULTISPECIES: hypothetical protein [unclassified Paenibacillus]
MEADMSMNDVVTQIEELQRSGQPTNKKKIKESNPQLLKNALYYFPSWEHALQSAESLH